MTRPASQLIYVPFQDDRKSPRVVTLHPHRAFADSMREIGLAASPRGRVVGLQSPKGVYLGREIVGYTWYVGPLRRPSPVHFGDALVELELFLRDELDRQPAGPAELPFLVGLEQGGVMALAAAAAVPDLLSGVVAIDAMFPIVPGWDPPLAPLAGLPILLVNSAAAEPDETAVITGDRLESTLTNWGGFVSTLREEHETVRLLAIGDWLARRPVRAFRT